MSVTRTSALSESSTARLDLDEQKLATCPLCHTTHPSLTAAALEAGGDWHCARCGQHWDASRLAHDAAYTAWAVEHDAPR